MIRREKLIKFVAKKEYARAFLDGKLYFNTLGYYMRNGFEAQNDPFEGTICAVSNQRFPILPTPWGALQTSDLHLRAVGYQYCNVLCFYRLGIEIDFPAARFLYDQNMREFGNYVIVVDHEEAFLQRISKAVREKHYLYGCKKVRYRTPKKDGSLPKRNDYTTLVSTKSLDLRGIPEDSITERSDSFVKSRFYENQNEWRITLYRGEASDAAYSLELGNLRDICHMVPAEKLTYDLRRIIDKADAHFLPPEYHGNASEQQLREAFYALGDYRADIILTV